MGPSMLIRVFCTSCFVIDLPLPPTRAIDGPTDLQTYLTICRLHGLRTDLPIYRPNGLPT